MFAKIDVDGNGLIEYGEFHNALASQLKVRGCDFCPVSQDFFGVGGWLARTTSTHYALPTCPHRPHHHHHHHHRRRPPLPTGRAFLSPTHADPCHL